MAVIKVGAPTETELKNRKLRIEDALNATRAAVEEGIVAGGGCTLIQLAEELDGLASQLQGDQRTGVEIVKRSLSAPLRQIAINAGGNGDVVVEEVRRSGKGTTPSPARSKICFRLASSMPPRWCDSACKMPFRSLRC